MTGATARWLVPALGFVALTGVLGVTIKLALRDVEWPVLLLWTGVVYAVLAGGAIVTGNVSVGFGPGVGWAVVSGLAAALGLICSFIALRHADAVVAVPVMSAYPLVTVLVSLAVLGEVITLSKVGGMFLVLAGVIVLAR
jgi:transporter family protein